MIAIEKILILLILFTVRVSEIWQKCFSVHNFGQVSLSSIYKR